MCGGFGLHLIWGGGFGVGLVSLLLLLFFIYYCNWPKLAPCAI